MDATFKQETLDNVERFYRETDDPKFDVNPALICLGDGDDSEDRVSIYVLNAENMDPPEQAAAALEHHIQEYGTPREVAFISAAWRRSPVTREIVGENVIVIFETVTERECVMYEVERDPLELKRMAEANDSSLRVPLLYNGVETIH